MPIARSRTLVTVVVVLVILTLVLDLLVAGPASQVIQPQFEWGFEFYR